MNGEYSEKLKTGGTLKVTLKNWFIEYYFKGPDWRYNGTFVTISGKDIDKYKKAWQANFNKYQELKGSFIEGSFNSSGQMGMSIRINDYVNGVCLKNYHMPINNQSKIDEIIRDYDNAKIKAEKIQKLLSQL